MAQLTMKQLEQMSPEQQQQAIRSMSDADLQALSQPAPSPEETLRNMSDEQLQELSRLSPAEQERALGGEKPKEGVDFLGALGGLARSAASLAIAPTTVGKQTLEGFLGGSRALESVTAAPTRAAVREFQESGDFGASFGAAKEQFGMAPEQAPTGKDIAAKAGISTEPAFSLPVIGEVSPAGAAGIVAEAVLDPTAFISFGSGTAAKGTGKALLKAVPLKENADDVVKAAQKLGTKATPGQLYDSQLVGRLEASLRDQPGRLGGIKLRSATKKNFQKLKAEADDLIGDVTTRDLSEIGAEAKGQIQAAVASKIKPSQEIYEGLVKQYGDEAADFTAIENALEELAESSIGSPDAVAEVAKWRKQVADLETVEHLQNFIKSTGRAGRSLDGDKAFVARSLRRAAKEARAESLEEIGGEIGAGDLIRAADENYRQAAEMVEDVLPRGRKIKDGIQDKLTKYLESKSDEGLVQSLLNTRDPAKLKQLQKSFPEAFEIMKQGKIASLADKAMLKGELNPKRLSKAIKEMPLETATLLFGDGAQAKANAVSIFVESMPAPANPSGTALLQSLNNIVNPLSQLGAISQSAALQFLTSGGRLQTAGGALQSFALPAQAVQQFGREARREPAFGIPQE